MSSFETIAAIATPPGEGGVAIIRLSGPKALEIANQIFSGNVLSYLSHTAHFGKVLDNGTFVDEALLIPMHAPKSYTGEDTVEIQCHGGSLISQKVLQTALKAGAKPAGPGEFTYRAFLNGKMDLAQAEAVQTLIGAKNHYSLELASQQLAGRLSQQVHLFQKELIDAAAILEAFVDFPEEGLAFASNEEVLASLASTLQKMTTLLATFEEGQKIHAGFTVCLAGPANAGKSSLLNLLLGQEKAIVTPIAGTTRDVLEATLYLEGLHFQLSDTAGIRTTDDFIEQEGIRRSKLAMQTADLILFVLDSSLPLDKETSQLLLCLPQEKTLLIGNKSDLSCDASFQKSLPSALPLLFLSTKTQTGLTCLKQQLKALLFKEFSKEEILLTTLRHKEAFTEACQNLEAVISGLKNEVSAEFLSADMRSCLKNLSQLIGMDISEDILNAIFAKFCIGK